MKKNKERAVLVTGGAGFIGSHLCEALLARGEKVICLDNFSTGRRENLVTFLDNPLFEFVEADIRTADLDEFDVCECYHLAALCGVPRVENEPLTVMLTCLEGMQNVFKWAASGDVKVVYVSSSEIYGNPLTHPQSETYWGFTNPVGPRSAYVEGKRAGEALARAYTIESGLNVKTARLFNVYGPRFSADDPRVIPQFTRAALAGERLKIYGTGECTRSFCFVDDIVRGLISLMETDGIHEPVNLGFPGEIDIRTLAELVIKLSGSSSGVVHLSPISEDPARRLPDISTANTLLCWSPEIHIEEGIKRTIQWYRDSTGASSILRPIQVFHTKGV